MTTGVSIIVPTYQEVENLPTLIARIQPLITSPNPLELIIVDDDSQDGTQAYLTTLNLPWIKCITRKTERDLSQSVIEGFHQAKYDILICMDADLSHPPEMISQMVAAIQQPHIDFVIGSRFISGGRVYNQWSFLRWANAFVAKTLARPFIKVKDPMSGFFCLKKATFQKADPLNPIGYKIGLELMVKCHCQHILEIPIRFDRRYKGKSKLNSREVKNYFQHLHRLLKYKINL